ncbi:uncharacterized protein LOC105446734 isoform X2 [Strongylocentrotus purpuratus]|uniref:UBP-type domain-containing protein n=1 Tax=Strongylocentrotus purpuratus TaxID=7668 RepID=A0A7M7PGJ2_STRPU|nr:uncharacterized protein LOC105446734 isoform X2 [Strongylocentrotus purpuratus]
MDWIKKVAFQLKTVKGDGCTHLDKSVSLINVKKALQNYGFGQCSVPLCAADSYIEEEDDEPVIWLCLACGNQGCSRYSPAQHALKHYESATSGSHLLVVDLLNWTVWCYKCHGFLCDDAIISSESGTLGECIDWIKKQAFQQKQTDYHNSSDEETVKGDECTHLNNSVSLNNVKKALKNHGFGQCSLCAGDSYMEEEDDEPVIWLCLACGNQGCSRYSPAQHALKHFETARSNSHPLVVCLSNWTVWCYPCHDFLCLDAIIPSESRKLRECIDWIKKQAFQQKPAERSGSKKKSREADVDESHVRTYSSPIRSPLLTKERSQPKFRLTEKLAPTAAVETASSRTKTVSSDEVIAANLAGSREQFTNLQRQLLGRPEKPQEMQERDAFLDWVKQAVAGLDKTLWRNFQREIQQLVNHYVDMQDQQQQERPSMNFTGFSSLLDSMSEQQQDHPASSRPATQRHF